MPIRARESAPGAGDHKDAIFLSPHKFIGGPQTPGILVVRRDLVRNRVPTVPGGGTVAFVDPIGHQYLDDPVAREEGGTPAIVESIRAGLVFALKQAVGTEVIQASEERLWKRALRRWSADPHIEVLGNPEASRLSIVSLRIRHGDRYLHHNYVVALLNDLFGIQARGGCSCAGPYGHRLLAIGAARSHAFRAEIGHGCEGIKPGWTRINFNYFISDTVADYLIEAVDLIADPRPPAAHRLPLRPPYRALAPPQRPAAAAPAPGRPALHARRHIALPRPAPAGRRGIPGRLPAPGPRPAGRPPGPHRRRPHRPARRLRSAALVPPPPGMPGARRAAQPQRAVIRLWAPAGPGSPGEGHALHRPYRLRRAAGLVEQHHGSRM